MSTGTSESRCPACGASVPAGRPRCPQCGRVQGEENRCPHCHAVAAVMPAGAGFVCAACNGPREKLPGTVVFERPALPVSRSSLAPKAASPGAQAAGFDRNAGDGAHAAATFLKAGGVVFFGAAAITLAAAVLVASLPGSAILGVAALGFGFGGGLFLRGGRSQKRKGDDAKVAALETALLRVAEKHGAVLTASDAARELGISVQDADRALTRMSDGTRVSLEVDDEGLIRYEFRELAAMGRRSVPAVRVADPDGEEATADAARAGERDRKSAR